MDATITSPRSGMTDITGCFGWATIDGAKFPYLLREEKKFVAVRMVEMKLLSKYPSSYPDELKNRPPLMSHYVTEKEVKLLNRINSDYCEGEYGNYQFTGQDLIVKLQDFEEFYTIVKKHFPDEVLQSLPQKPKVSGGWIQVNNTVVPFVMRGDCRFVPLPVIRYAAGLLTDIQVDGDPPSDEESKHFNDICKQAGLNFKFSKSTKLAMLNLVQSLSTTPVTITELPEDDPFNHAEYKGEQSEEPTRLPTQVAPGSVPTGIPPGNPPGMIPPGAIPPGLGFPPGVVPPGAMVPPGMPPAGNPYWMNPHIGIFPGFGGAGPNPFLMQQRPPPPSMSPGGEVNNNNRSTNKELPERPNSQGSNASSIHSGIRRSSTGTPVTTPSPTGQMQSQQIRPPVPSAAAGGPSGLGILPPGLPGQGLLSGGRMMFPMMQNQNPSDYQKLMQMVQLQQQQMKAPGKM